MDKDEKRLEDRLRKKLARRGYRLMKNRCRSPEAYNYQGYMIVNADTNFVVAGAHIGQFDLDLDEVKHWVNDQN